MGHAIIAPQLLHVFIDPNQNLPLFALLLAHVLRVSLDRVDFSRVAGRVCFQGELGSAGQGGGSQHGNPGFRR